MDPRIQKLADVLVNYSIEVKPGDWVVIEAPVAGEPLAAACVRSVLRAGGKPSVLIDSEQVAEAFLTEANDEQLQFVPPFQELEFNQANGRIAILAPSNTRNLASIDPSRMSLRSKALDPLSETFMRRWFEGSLRWTGTQFPTLAAAQDAGMSLREYEDFVYTAGLLDEPDPAAAWKAVGERQQRLVEWLRSKSEVRIVAPGTDLRVNVAGRTWMNDDAHANFPGGEVFTGPHEDATEGTIQFNFPAVFRGQEVTGIRLEFQGGMVVDAAANSGEKFLHEMLDMDAGARRLGEFAIGTNPGIQRFTRNALFDEKIGGTIHMALGRSIPPTGGVNISALHWDIVLNLREGAEVTADGELLSHNGEFVAGF